MLVKLVSPAACRNFFCKFLNYFLDLHWQLLGQRLLDCCVNLPFSFRFISFFDHYSAHTSLTWAEHLSLVTIVFLCVYLGTNQKLTSARVAGPCKGWNSPVILRKALWDVWRRQDAHWSSLMSVVVVTGRNLLAPWPPSSHLTRLMTPLPPTLTFSPLPHFVASQPVVDHPSPPGSRDATWPSHPTPPGISLPLSCF